MTSPSRSPIRTSLWAFVCCSPRRVCAAAAEACVCAQSLGQDVLNNAYNGFNCALFAYGQTGSGKSYSMFGTPEETGIGSDLVLAPSASLSPRLLCSLALVLSADSC